MGHDRLEFGVKIRRFLVISIRTCYRSVCSHPFIVGMVCFLIFLYRSFPFAFSLLVSGSPVLVCTAISLGTLLSFGQPNIPEIEEEEKVTHESASLKTWVAKDTSVVERDGSFTIERYVRKRRDVVEDATEEGRLVDSQVSELEEGSGSVDYRLLVDESSQEIQSEKPVIEELKRGFDSESEKKREIREDKLGIEEVSSDVEVVENRKVADENLEGEDDRSLQEIKDAQKEDQMDTSPVSPWKPMRHDEDDDDAADDESLDFGSDGVESSSPDASMADIIPLLDELHPLLDSETPQLVHMSRDGSDDASEGPNRSIDEGDESDVDTEDHGEEGDDYNDDDEEEEEEGEAQGDKEDGSKSAIKWTEDDQKNLMDLGTSELERNQRLENLIARRRARKSLKLMAEKNLIDLDTADIPINVSHISTTRCNPFDLPYHSSDDMGLPPIPGSAPSILLPRRNPFDLPYDSNEEKPDLKEDNFHQEFSVSHQKEPLFRRHESFSVGPSVLGGPKQDRQDGKLRPYFVPERLATEGTSYPSFEKQPSEISESKVSSIPDTESVSSAVEEEEEEEKLNEQDISGKIEMMSNADHASVHDEYESQSSVEVDSVDIEQAEKRDVHHDVVEITLGDEESHHEMELSLSEAVGATTLVELNAHGIHSKSNPVEEYYNGISSLSSLSEVDEKISEVGEEEASTSLEPRSDQAEESGISAQPSLEESEFHFMSGMVDDHPHKEPVYDSSPLSIENFLSFSSVSSDNQVEISEMGSPPAMLNSLDQELEAPCENIEKDASGFKDMHAVSSVHAVDENESRSREVMEINGLSGVDPRVDGHDRSMVPESVLVHVSVDLSLSSSYKERGSHHGQDQVYSSSRDAEILAGVHQDVNETSDSVASSQKVASKDLTMAATVEQPPSVMVEHASTSHAGLSFSETEHVEKHGMDMEGTLPQLWGLSEDGPAAEGMMLKEKFFRPEQGQALSPSSDAGIHIDGRQNVGKEFSSMASIVPSSDSTLSAKEKHSPAAANQVSDGHSSLSYPEVEHAKDNSSTKGDILGRDQAQSSNSNAKIDTLLYGDMDVKVVSVDSSNRYVPSEEKSSSELEKQLSWSDKSMVEPSIHEDSEHRVPSIIPMEYAEGINFVRNANLREVHDPNIFCLTSDSTSLPSETPDFKSLTVGEDMKGYILDGILYEDRSHVSEHLDFATEAYGSHVAQENINEEADEMKEIDERLLSELDIVGDFSIKEVVDESLKANLSPQRTNAGSTESGLSPKDSNLTEKNVELPVLEARSVEDIDSAFKQIHEGAKVEEVILPSMVEDQLAADRSEDAMEIKSELPVVEARSLEEIHIALKQVSEGNVDELAKPLEPEGSKAGSTKSGLSLKDSNLKEKNVELPVLEARSVEDIDSAFKQIHEGAEVEEVILPSMVENQLAADKSEDPMQIKSELPVVEARSLEEIHIAMKQVSEGYVDELPKPLEPEGSNAGSAKSGLSPKDSNLTEKNVKLPILEVRSVEDIDSAFKQIHEGAEVEEVILPSIVEDQLAADKSEDPMEIKSKLPVVEARYLDDIHTALKQVSEGNLDELPKRLESKCAPQEVEANDPIEFKSELPVVEAISHTALKHVSKGNLDDELPKPLESKSAPSKVKTSNLVEIKSELTVVEAGSLEGTALEQVSRGNLDELPKPLESKDVSVEVKTNIVVSTKETESSNVESGVKESSRIVGDEPKLVFEEKSENSSLSTFDRKSKKE